MASSEHGHTGEPGAVLLVGRQETARLELARVFEQEGYETHQSETAEQADVFLSSRSADLVLLQGQATETSVLAFCRRIRRVASTPILVISDNPDLVDEIVVLETGADGLLPRDVDTRLLLARSRALLRRAEARADGSAGQGEWRVDAARRILVLPSGGQVVLTPLMLDLMSVFLAHPGVVLTAETAAELLGRPKSEADHLRTPIARLRRRLAAAGEQFAIRTVHGQGYVFDGVAASPHGRLTQDGPAEGPSARS